MFLKRVLTICLCFICFSGCTMPSSSQQIPSIRIGIVLYRQDDTFISLLSDQLRAIALHLEQEKNIKLDMEIVDGNYNQGLQNDKVISFIQKQYDIICVNIVDRTAAANLIDSASNAKIPLIFFNREPVEEDVRRWNKVYYVGADAHESGKLQASLVIDLWKQDATKLDKNGDGKLQYVILEGDPGHQDALIRTNAAVNTITSAGIHLEKLATGIAYWQRVQASTKMALWLQKYNSKIELVIANNDDMALGALDAIESVNFSPSPAVVGIDGTPVGLEAVYEGKMLGTVYNNAREQADGILRLACALACNESTEKIHYLNGQYVRVPYLRVDQTNVMQYMDFSQ